MLIQCYHGCEIYGRMYKCENTGLTHSFILTFSYTSVPDTSGITSFSWINISCEALGV